MEKGKKKGRGKREEKAIKREKKIEMEYLTIGYVLPAIPPDYG